MRKLQVDILGLSTSPHTNGAYALILYEVEGKRKLPIIIGGFEAQAIALKLENIKPPHLKRPLKCRNLQKAGSRRSNHVLPRP